MTEIEKQQNHVFALYQQWDKAHIRDKPSRMKLIDVALDELIVMKKRLAKASEPVATPVAPADPVGLHEPPADPALN